MTIKEHQLQYSLLKLILFVTGKLIVTLLHSLYENIDFLVLFIKYLSKFIVSTFTVIMEKTAQEITSFNRIMFY